MGEGRECCSARQGPWRPPVDFRRGARAPAPPMRLLCQQDNEFDRSPGSEEMYVDDRRWNLPHSCTLGWVGGWNGRAVAPREGVFSVAEELRDFRDFLVAHTVVEELRGLNLLGIQFALCEASKWLFYLRSLVLFS